MHEDLKEIWFDEDQIQDAVKDIAWNISHDYKGRNLLLIGVLKGSFIFLADLVRHITIPCEVDFMQVCSYHDGTESSGKITMIRDTTADVEGRHVIIVEDIFDTGYTLKYVKDMLSNRGPASIKICTMFEKPSRREVDLHPDYTGYEVANEFIVGYGLDYDEKYRDLPYVGVLKPEVYSK